MKDSQLKKIEEHSKLKKDLADNSIFLKIMNSVKYEYRKRQEMVNTNASLQAFIVTFMLFSFPSFLGMIDNITGVSNDLGFYSNEIIFDLVNKIFSFIFFSFSLFMLICFKNSLKKLLEKVARTLIWIILSCLILINIELFTQIKNNYFFVLVPFYILIARCFFKENLSEDILLNTIKDANISKLGEALEHKIKTIEHVEELDVFIENCRLEKEDILKLLNEAESGLFKDPKCCEFILSDKNEDKELLEKLRRTFELTDDEKNLLIKQKMGLSNKTITV